MEVLFAKVGHEHCFDFVRFQAFCQQFRKAQMVARQRVDGIEHRLAGGQLPNPDATFAMVKQWATRLGAKVGAPYAEGFVRIDIA